MTLLCEYLVSQPNGLILRLFVPFIQPPLNEETFLFVPFHIDSVAANIIFLAKLFT